MSGQKETNAFIKNVHLKGYKSVKDLKVRLNNGLNIIIGPNGSGKTNFVEFLSDLLELNSTIKSNQSYFSSITFQSEKIEFKVEKVYEKKLRTEDFEGEDELKITYLVENDAEFSNIFIFSKKYKLKISRLLPLKIPFTTPKEFESYMLSKLGQLYVKKNSNTIVENILITIFENDLIDFAINFLENNNNFSESNVISALKIKNSLIENLNKFSPIKNIKLSKGLTFYSDNNSFNINYLMLEFYVNNDWLTWAELSDGTKRIFHIISEINHRNGIIFLEEPENGVHPDQLRLLLDFIVEQSKTKQIILTTHAPEVLNVLYEDELDRIIVTRFEEETGTQMHHLSEKQKKKGQSYMKNVGFLSMFWSNSSLEKYVPEEHE